MSAVFYILLGWLLTILAAWGWGALPLRWLKLDAPGHLANLYRFLLGAATLSLLLFALAFSHLIYKGSLYAVLGLGLVLLLWRRPAWPPIPWTRSAWLYSGFGLYYFAYALMPEMSPDGMSYHLGLTARYYREQGFSPLGDNMYASLSQGLEMLFLAAFGIGRHSAAALVHFTFLLLVPPFLALHAGVVGWRAGLFVFLLPLVGLDGVSAYNDVALTLVVFAVVDSMSRWRTTANPAWVSAAALLAGFAFSIKYTAAAAALLLLPAWRLWPRWSLALLCSLPWLVKNYLFTGNPAAPFFNAWFPNEFFTVEFENNYRAFLRHYDVSGPREWFREIIFGGPKLSGFLGPAALLLPFGLLAFRQPLARWWFSAAAIFLALYPLNIGTRFLLPVLPYLALGLFSVLKNRYRYALAVALICAWPTARARYSSPHTWNFDRIEWRAALRLESEETYLVRKRPGYITARTIETFLPPDARVFAVAPIAESYTSRHIITAYQSKLGQQLHHALAAHAYEGYQSRAVYHCSANTITVAHTSPDTWSITEIEPRPQSITCSRMPWDARFAIDGFFTSRYRTWAPARAGDSCTLTGQGPWRLWATTDQWQVELAGCRREILAAPGKDAPDYRADARRFFLSQNVPYLAIDNQDFGAADLKANASLWGLELIAERGAMRIYRWKQ